MWVNKKTRERTNEQSPASNSLRNNSNSYSVTADELFRIGNAYEIIYDEDRPLKGSLVSFTNF